jgi:glucans biosynthesis protein C
MDAGARRPEIDALRVGAILLVFAAHAAQIFSPFEDWHIRSPDTSWLLGQFTVLLAPWIMPLFMFLAGASAWFSRSRRGDLEFVRVRVARLLVPLVAGTFLLIPPQIYLRRVSRGEFEGGFLEFLPTFTDGFFPEGNFSWGHLWFLAYLFTYLLVAIPVFRFLDSARGRTLVGRIAQVMQRPGGVLLPVLPLAAGQLALRIAHPQTTGALVGDWATHGWLFPVLIYGYLLLADPRILDSIVRQWRWALGPALGASAGLAVWAWNGDVYNRIPGGALTGEYVFFWVAFTTSAWCWLATFLAWAVNTVRSGGRVLHWATPLVYPFYIFHQTVIVIVAFFLVALPVGPHARFALISAVSLAGTLISIELVRRIPGLRALFGLAPGRD